MANAAACPRHERHVCRECLEKDAGGGDLSSSEDPGKGAAAEGKAEGAAAEGKAEEGGGNWWSRQSKATKYGLVGAGAAAVLVAWPVALTVVGFGAEGILVGSPAALWQSSIVNVPAGSLFAFLQSAGAAGWGMSATAGGAAVVSGGAVGAAAGKTKEATGSASNACKCERCGAALP